MSDEKREPITPEQAEAVYRALAGMDYIGGSCDEPDWKTLAQKANERIAEALLG